MWIPEEIMMGILSHVPVRSLHKFMLVSKSWSSLIIQEILPKLSPPSAGLFYRLFSSFWIPDNVHLGHTGERRSFHYMHTTSNTSSLLDPTLTFMMPHLTHSVNNLDLLGCCNGLLLVSRHHTDFYVCNPVTKSWSHIPPPPKHISYRRTLLLLDFNPQLSPDHYRIVSFSFSRSHVFISLYSSGAREWEQKKSLPCRVDISHVFSAINLFTLWKGSMYVVTRSNRREYWTFGDAGRITRFGLLDGDADQETIEFPLGTKKPRRIGLVRMRDNLCLVGLDGMQLRLWSLSKRDQNVWLMDQRIDILNIVERTPADSPHVVGFDPYADVVFILSNRRLYAYNLMKMSLGHVYSVGSETPEIAENKSGIIRATFFPFSPCSLVLQDKHTDGV